MKRILLLGGSRYLLPVIREAHTLGHYVITCDYLPEGIAHRFSDEYRNVSIVDREQVLRTAKELQVDGIMSFATDPGVTTAAYVCEQLGLPTCPYRSVEILQSKDLFRDFLRKNRFHVPWSASYDDPAAALRDHGCFPWPVIVKPVDSAGSKGVTRVDSPNGLEAAVRTALKFSLNGRFIIEEFIEKGYDSSDTDCFSIDGKLVFISFSNQKFDRNADNPYAPSAYSWPSKMPEACQKELTSELQRLVTLLGLGTSIYNVETRTSTDGIPYIMEFTPRGGGNRLAEVLHYATGVNLIRGAVKAAVGDRDLDITQKPYVGHWGEYMLHSNAGGVFESLEIAKELQPFVYETDLWLEKGDTIREFTGANAAIGSIVLRFDSGEKLDKYIDHIGDFIHVNVR